MMNTSNGRIKETGKDWLLLEDLGPWDKFLTITNDAEHVVEWLFEYYPVKETTRFFYIDSEGEKGELLHKDGVFTGFR